MLEQLACGAGPYCDRPLSMMFNLANASPEVVRAMVEENTPGGQASQEHISVMAHDVWAAGCLLARQPGHRERPLQAPPHGGPPC